jgi:hypothetical protein
VSVTAADFVNTRLFAACLDLFKRYPGCVGSVFGSTEPPYAEMFLDYQGTQTFHILGSLAEGMTGFKFFIVRYLRGGVNDWNFWHVAGPMFAMTRERSQPDGQTRDTPGFDPALLHRLSRGLPYGPSNRLFGYRPSTIEPVSAIVSLRGNQDGRPGILGPDQRSHARVEPILAEPFLHEATSSWPQPLWYLGAWGLHTLLAEGRLVPLDEEIARQPNPVWLEDHGVATVIHPVQPSGSLLLTGRYHSFDQLPAGGTTRRAHPPADLRETCRYYASLDRDIRALLSRL